MNNNSQDSILSPHLLQSPLWGQVKAGFGWKPEVFRSQTAQAQVLFRQLPLGLSLAYLPKGPVGKNWDSLWPQIDIACKKHRAAFLQVEPDLGVLLPCNVVMYATPRGTRVTAVNAGAMLGMVGNPALERIAAEVGRRLDRVLESL